MAPQRDFLTAYLQHAPVALALLRAIECRELDRVDLQAPLLDLGCGDGVFGQIFFAERPLVGLDRSWRELRTCRKREAYRALVQGDIACLPFPDAHFGTVFSNGVLEHVADLQAGLREIARVLRDDGRLILTVPTMRDELELSGAALLRRMGWQRAAQRYADAYNRVFGQINVFDLAEWREILAANGLCLIEHRAYAGPHIFRLHDVTMLASWPNMFIKELTGRWVLSPHLRRVLCAPFWAGLLRRLYSDSSGPGCSLLLVAAPNASAIRRKP